MIDLEKDKLVPEPSTLQLLGKRMERLFLIGLILIALCMGEMYLATANLQISQDRSTTAIKDLLEGIQADRPRLDRLFATRSDKPAVTTEPASSKAETRKSRVAATRTFLGLPPEIPSQPSAKEPLQPPRAETYQEALAELVGRAVRDARASNDELKAFLLDVDPAELVTRLEAAKASREKQPTSVWGIQTPRLMNIEYSGLAYQLPYGFLATVLAATLGPLAAAWLASVYMTRQREIFEIVRTQDFKLVFPHILNFIPVRFQYFTSIPPSQRIPGDTFNSICQTALRVLIILVFVAPILYALCFSFFQLWEANDEDLPWIVYPSMGFTLFFSVQAFLLVIYESVALKNKLFIED